MVERSGALDELADEAIAQEQAGKKRLPILALTAGTPAEVREQVLASGMDDVLPKPIGLDSLKQAIAEWCGDAKPLTTLDPDRITAEARVEARALVRRAEIEGLG